MNDKKKTTPVRPPVRPYDAYEDVYGYPVRPGTLRPQIRGTRVG
jgi:hypothetical protein